MRVAVIGGTGLVGRHLTSRLRDDGHQVVVAARHLTPGPGLGFGPRVELRATDVTRPHGLEEAIDGCDAVVSAFGSMVKAPDQSFHDVHQKGAQHLVAACRAKKVRRLVHLSALGAQPSSRSAFLRTKHAGEDLVRRSLLDVTVLRPSIIYGAGDGFLNPLARLLQKLPMAPLPGRGASRLQPIAVADVVQAIVAVLARGEQGDTLGEAIDLPGPETLPIAEVYQRVLRTLGIHRPRLGVPYLLIEPLAQLFDNVPGIHFSFDQLALLEEEPAGDPQRAAARLGLTLTPFDETSIHGALDERNGR